MTASQFSPLCEQLVLRMMFLVLPLSNQLVDGDPQVCNWLQITKTKATLARKIMYRPTNHCSHGQYQENSDDS